MMFTVIIVIVLLLVLLITQACGYEAKNWMTNSFINTLYNFDGECVCVSNLIYIKSKDNMCFSPVLPSLSA